MQETIKIQTQGNTDIIDITDTIQGILNKSNTKEGIVNIFVKHTTAGIAIIEIEKGILQDLKQTLNKLIPQDQHYNHNELQHDDNAHSHLKASLLKPDINVPFQNNKLLLGIWQRITLIDFDTHSREREVVITILQTPSTP